MLQVLKKALNLSTHTHQQQQQKTTAAATKQRNVKLKRFLLISANILSEFEKGEYKKTH